MHDVDGRLALLQQALDGLLHRGHHVLVLERHGPGDAGDPCGWASGPAGEVVRDGRDVAEGGGHEQELRPFEHEQRHLPGPATVGVAVEVELVHHHDVDVGVGSLAQRQVREDLGGAADDRGVGVDGRVARDHADVLGAEQVDELEELLGDQGLDRRGVVAPLALREGGEVGAGRDERLAGAGRGAQDDVGAGHQLDEGFVLRRVQRPSAGLCPVGEGLVDGVGVDDTAGGRRHRGDERGSSGGVGHVPILPARPWPTDGRPDISGQTPHLPQIHTGA